jgi:hypothetical protein
MFFFAFDEYLGLVRNAPIGWRAMFTQVSNREVEARRRFLLLATGLFLVAALADFALVAFSS